MMDTAPSLPEHAARWWVNRSFLAVTAGVAASAITSFASLVLANRRTPAAYRIAILGFPRCGKTTLITAVFDYLFSKGIRGASIVPRGEETRERINSDIGQLELGRSVQPTTDQTVFAYRVDIKFGSSFLATRYKLELGDFPGEYTEKLSEVADETWLHKTSYFSWAVSADAFIFVVDTGKVLADPTGAYVVQQKTAFRAAWQRLQESYLDGSTDLAKRPLLLVFAKADLLFVPPDRVGALSHEVPPGYKTSFDKITRDEIAMREAEVKARFSDLIEYLDRVSRRFAIVFSSVYLRPDGERLGIPSLANYIMPRPSLWPVRSQSPKE